MCCSGRSMDKGRPTMKKKEKEKESKSYGFSRQVESQHRCFHFGAVQ